MDVGFSVDTTCQQSMDAFAVAYSEGWQVYNTQGHPLKFYPNPHYVKWKRGRPSKEAQAKRRIARDWMPDEWTQNEAHA